MVNDVPYEIRDPRFALLVREAARLERLWTGGTWLEGPVHLPASGQLLFSDIPNDRTLRLDEVTGEVTVAEQPAGNQNGHTLDRDGRVLSCEHLSRSVTRTEHDGRRVVVADRFEGKRLNSPNDVVVHSDGSVWFSDPTYGIDSDHEGKASPSEIGASYVYRVDPTDGTVSAIVTDMVQPNGLAFSRDESILYVADSGGSHRGADCPPVIRAYPVGADGRSVGPGETLATCEQGFFDGFRVDDHGNLWTSAADGVHCLADDGTLLGKVLVPEVVANVELVGARLYICATTSLYAIG